MILSAWASVQRCWRIWEVAWCGLPCSVTVVRRAVDREREVECLVVNPGLIVSSHRLATRFVGPFPITKEGSVFLYLSEFPSQPSQARPGDFHGSQREPCHACTGAILNRSVTCAFLTIWNDSEIWAGGKQLSSLWVVTMTAHWCGFNDVLQEMLENIVFAYLCDILTQSPNMDFHIPHICQVQKALHNPCLVRIGS